MSENFAADLENLGYTVKREGVSLRVSLPLRCGVRVVLREGKLWLDPVVGFGKISRHVAHHLLTLSWMLVGLVLLLFVTSLTDPETALGTRALASAAFYGLCTLVVLLSTLYQFIATEGAMGTIRQLYLSKYLATSAPAEQHCTPMSAVKPLA
jgi:hypothetical protein